MKFVIIICLIGNFIFSQNNPVTFFSEVVSSSRAGEVVEIKILASMEDQWKIYSVHKIAEGPLPTEINITGDIIGLIGPIIEPNPDYAFDPGFESETYYHSGKTEFSLFFSLKRDLKPGIYPINIDFYFHGV